MDFFSGTTCSGLAATPPNEDNGLSLSETAAPKAGLFEAKPMFVVEPNIGTAASKVGLLAVNPAAGVAGIF